MWPWRRTVGIAAGLFTFLGAVPGSAVHGAGASALSARAVPGPSIAPTSTSTPAPAPQPQVPTSVPAARRNASSVHLARARRARVAAARRARAARRKAAQLALARAWIAAIAARRPVPAPAPSETEAPASCASVIASVVWPAGWHAVCGGARVGILGLTGPNGVTTLYVRPGETATLMRTVALHEAGHAWDFTHLTPPKISQWCAARGCSAQYFFSGGASGAGWHEPGGAEDWAASWDACHGGTYHRSYLGLGPPTPSQCALQNALVGYTG